MPTYSKVKDIFALLYWTVAAMLGQNAALCRVFFNLSKRWS
jgi:hypothetical protein